MEEIQLSSLTQDVIKYSREEALGLGNETISTPHLLLGIIKQGNSNAIQILVQLRCDVPKLRNAIESKFSGNANASTVDNVPVSKEAEKALRIAVLESKLYKSELIEPEHLLLSLLRNDEFLSAQLLSQFDIDYNLARDALDNILSNIAVNDKLKDRIKRPKPLFKIAAEFDVSTQTIVGILKNAGYEAENRPNFKITPKLYEYLDNYFTHYNENYAVADTDKEIQKRLGIPFSKGSGLSEVDYLGRENLVQSLASMIASPKQETPFTIGLLGDWGSGKSNVMYLLRKALKSREDKRRFYFADFNAWQYEHTDNMAAGVAQEVLSGIIDNKSIGEKLKIRWEFGIKENGKKTPIALSVLAFILIVSFIVLFSSTSSGWVIGSIVSLILSLGFLATLIKKATLILGHPFTTKVNSYLKLPSYADHLGTIPMLQRHLQTLCNIVIPKVDAAASPSRLVVFVDDLDRCEPETISRTLDAIRLVMDIDNVVAVIGIDHRIAFRAVEKQYQDLADDERTSSDIARDYLGKIIQLPISLSKPSEKELDKFIRSSLFKGIDINEEERQGMKIISTDQDERGELIETVDETIPTKSTSFSVEQYGGSVNKESNFKNKMETFSSQDMQETTDEMNHFSKLCHLFEMNNPRQLIRLKNCYRLLKRLSTGSEFWKEKMTMLFWLDFLYAQKRESRIAIEKCFANQNFKELNKCSDRGYLKSKIINELKSVFKIDNSDFSTFNELKSQVKRLVLPHSESYDKAKREEDSSDKKQETES